MVFYNSKLDRLVQHPPIGNGHGGSEGRNGPEQQSTHGFQAHRSNLRRLQTLAENVRLKLLENEMDRKPDFGRNVFTTVIMSKGS